VFVAADGMHFTTHDGKQVIDGISSLWCVGAGHNRKPINEAIKKQLDTLDYATAFQASNDQAFKAAEVIANMAPGDLNKVLFCNSGSEAADTSLKVALAYHRARGEGHRNIFIGREKGYHGVGFGGMSVGGIPANRKVYGAALLPRVDHMRFIHDPVNHAYINGTEPVWEEDLLLELENRILPLHDPSNVAAIIVEPVSGSAGWYLPPKGYLKRLREICDKHGILLIFDEVITGFGRLGTAFGADYYGVVPDMLNFAKCVTNGVIPLGGVICTDRIYDGMMNANSGAPEHAIEFFHGYTYSGHPVACAAAIATLKLLEEEKLYERAGPDGQGAGRRDAQRPEGPAQCDRHTRPGPGRRGGTGAPGRCARQARLRHLHGMLPPRRTGAAGGRQHRGLPALHRRKRAHRPHRQRGGRRDPQTRLRRLGRLKRSP
jgi:beta-alanine--pyruvate transaminase